jgi:hypothetical protein
MGARFMIDIADIAIFLAVGAVASFVMSLYFPTRTNVRQWSQLISYAAIGGAAAFYLAEQNGLSAVLDPAHRDYIIVGALSFIGAMIMVLTVDLYFNFDALKDDPAYAMLGRPGLAIGMLGLAVCAMTAITIAWYQIDPAIFETRGNIVFLRAVGSEPDLADFFSFALDQTQKALLLDISEVYRVGLIDIGNNPMHIAFSTACLVYRTFFVGVRDCDRGAAGQVIRLRRGYGGLGCYWRLEPTFVRSARRER